MKRYLVVLSACFFAAQANETQDATIAVEIATAIVKNTLKFTQSEVLSAITTLEENDKKVDFIQTLRAIFHDQNLQSCYRNERRKGAIAMTIGLTLCAGSIIYLLTDPKLTKATCLFGKCPLTLKRHLGSLFMLVAGGPMAIAGADKFARFKSKPGIGYNHIAQTLRLIKESPACFISDKERAKELLAYMRSYLPTKEHAELDALIASI